MWWKQIIGLLAGGVPLLLFLGGALAVYLGYDEVKDKFIKKAEPPVYEPPKVSEVEVVQYKGEEERLEAKIEEPEKKTKPKKKTEPKKKTSQEG